MKILFYRYNSICEPDYIDAFSKLGVTVVEDRDGMNKGLSIDEKLQNLGNMISEHKPMFVFSINFFPFLSILCSRLNIVYVAESVDCPVFEIFHESVRNRTNRLFLFDRQQYLSVRDENPEGIFYLPLGSPTERTGALLGNSFKPEYDISFVGSLYKEKDPFIDLELPPEVDTRFSNMIQGQLEESCSGMEHLDRELTQEDIDIVKRADKNFYSNDNAVINLDRFVVLNDYLAPHTAYLERLKILNLLADEMEDVQTHLFTRSETDGLSSKVKLHGGVKSLEEMPFVFRNSRINLNISLRSIRTGLPQRIWDVLACGGFLLTNDQAEIPDFFTPGVHLETYSTTEELMEKARYYLEHEDERRKIAENGFKEVNEKHTVLMRVMSIVKMVFSTMQGAG
jgi:spore maturation protein CgeB